MTGRTIRLAALLLGLAGLLPAHIYHGIAVPPGGRHAWVVRRDSMLLYHTDNLGASWEPQVIPNSIRAPYDAFFLDSTTGWACGDIGDIQHTQDGGRHWERQDLGGTYLTFRIRFLDDSTGWASGTGITVKRTTDHGTHWTTEWPCIHGINYPDSFDLHGISFPSRETGWASAGVLENWEGGDSFPGGQGLVIWSTDAGDSWELLFRDTVFDFYDVCFTDTRNGVLVGGEDSALSAVVLRTTDAGQNWHRADVPSGSGFLTSVEFEGPSHGWACGCRGTIIHTWDGGEHWETLPTPTESVLYDIEFADVLRGMACGAGVILVTTNSGATWTESRIGIAEPPAGGQERASALQLLTNPTRAGPVFEVAGVRLPCLLAVYDPSGRLMMSVPVSGPHVALPARPRPGVYYAHLLAPGTVATTSFVVLE